MHEIAKKVINTFLNEQKIPTIEELWAWNNENVDTKFASFVTLYKDWKVIASSWRVNIKKSNTILELIENSLFCLKDPRFIESIKNPLEIRNVKFRVDIIKNEHRKLVSNLEEIDINKHWLVIISQTLWKMWVLLPHMTNLASSPKDLFDIVCKKADIDQTNLKEEDYYLYSLETEEYSDF